MKLSYRIYFFVLFPIILLPLALVHNTKPFLCTYMLVIMSAFWALDILPYGITSLIPILFAPLMDIQVSNCIAKTYSSDSLMLCLGRLILACAFQRHQIHRRFGLFLLTKIGPQPRQIILACMIPSHILTMFISNTATAPIMLEFAIEMLKIIKDVEERIENIEYSTAPDDEIMPINIHLREDFSDNLGFLNDSPLVEQFPSMTSVIARNKKINKDSLQKSTDKEKNSKNNKMKYFSRALFLSTGWAASCGSLATIVASGPNLVFYGIVQKDLGYDVNLNYGTFMAVGLPLSIVLFILTWVWVGTVNMGPREFFAIRKNTIKENVLKKEFQKAKDELGVISFPEVSCIFLTALVIILWISRSLSTNAGWGYLFSKGNVMFVSDATPMILVIILIYIWPSQWKFWKTEENIDPGAERLLSWDFTHKSLPWSIIFLLGAGFAMTDVCNESGLSDIVGSYIAKLDSIPVGAIVVICCILASVATEFFSSTTILPIYLVIFFKVACHMKVHPFYFSLPLTFASSTAFCLPSATTPNIAIFNRGLATTFQMIKSGILMDLVFLFIVAGFTFALGIPVFSLNTFPTWFHNCSFSKYGGSNC